MNEQTFAEKVQNKLPAGTVLDNPGGGQMAILSYNGTKMVYQRGNSPITADLHDLWNAYYYFDQRKPCDVDSAALRQRYPLVFDPHQNGHAANCTMTYGNIYVASVALGANYQQAIKALSEAEAYDGPAIVIAYAHCIAHGIEMRCGLNEAKKAVQSGRWILYRFNPALRAQGKNPLAIDSGKPTMNVEDYMTRLVATSIKPVLPVSNCIVVFL